MLSLDHSEFMDSNDLKKISAQPLRSQFLKKLAARGFLHQTTNLSGLDELLNNAEQNFITGHQSSPVVKKTLAKPIACYIGFDATAASLHVGSLISIMLLRHFQQSGHRPIVLMGGGTSMIGDPSGKDEARKILTAETINNNIIGIKKIFSRYLTFDDNHPNSAVVVNNADWLLSLHYIDFLRETGKYFSVNRMLQMEAAKLRLEREQNLSFLEFNYMVLQAYDFQQLFKSEHCWLQMGGSDQWGNIVMGVELIRKTFGVEAFGITTPLLTTASGAKMGKTTAGAIWLDAELLSVYDFWQFWRNVEDADVIRFLKLFTDLPLTEIDHMATWQGAELNHAKIILANEVTSLCHGKDAAKDAANTAAKLFSMKDNSKALTNNLPTWVLHKQLPETDRRLIDVIKNLGFAKSNGEAKRLIEQNGVILDGKSVTNIQQILTEQDFLTTPEKKLLLVVGKKKHGIIIWQ